MSVTLAEGVVEVTADASKIPRKIRDDINGNQGPLEDAGRTSAGSFGGIFKGSLLGNFVGNIASDIVGQIGYAIGSGIRTAVEFGIGGIDIASGVAEAKTAIGSIFGEGSDTVETFAAGASKSIGQSNLDALKAAQNFGVFGKAAGLAGEDNARFSSTLVQTASDFASFYDTSPEDAIVAIGAALRGEYEPIRQYGLLIDEATLKQQAMSMGIYDGEGSLTQQQKVLAANALIVSDANASYNDFTETSGGLANQQRTLKASLEDAQGALGEALLPAMLNLTTFANDTLVPILNDVIEVVGPMLGDALTEAAPAVVEFLTVFAESLPSMIEYGAEILPLLIDGLTAIMPVLKFLVEDTTGWLTGLSTLFGVLSGDTSIAEADAAIAGIGGTLGWLIGVVTGAAGAVGTAVGWIGDRFALGGQQIGQFFGDLFGKFAEGGRQIGQFAGEVGRRIGEAAAFVGELPGRAMSALGDLGNFLFRQGQKLIQGFINGISDMIGGVGDAISGVLDFAAGFFPNSPAKRGPFSGDGWTAIGRAGGAIGEQFASGLEPRDFAIPFTTTANDTVGRGSRMSSTMPNAYGASAPSNGGGNMYVEINEATDPLGSAGRVGRELRQWK